MKVYRNDMPHADFPLGGIGTGTITLTAAGRLIDFQIFNRPSLGAKVPYSFFSMYSRWGEHTDARALEAEPVQDHYKARGYHPLNTMGLPKFTSSEMTVRYPFAEIAFTDAALGFQSIYSFSRAFKKRENVSPSVYRRCSTDPRAFRRGLIRGFFCPGGEMPLDR